MANTRILFWNCHGMAPKRLELFNFVQNRKVDILLLNETYLTNTRQLKLLNFYTNATNRSQVSNHQPGGETAVQIRRRYIHYQVHIQTNSIKNTKIYLQLKNKEVNLSAVYKKPTELLDPTDIHMTLNTNMNNIIARHLNSKDTIWNSRTTNATRNLLERCISARND